MGKLKNDSSLRRRQKQWVTWGLETPKHELQIYVTKTGKVRIHDKRGEWTPTNNTKRKIIWQ